MTGWEAAVDGPVDGPVDVLVVIVTYRDAPLLGACLDALLAHPPKLGWTCTVVINDSGSSSTVLDTCRSRSWVRTITRQDNTGFGGGNNLAMLDTVSRHVVLLNADVIVTEGWFEPLHRLLDDPSVGIATPSVLWPDGSVEEHGGGILADGTTTNLGRWGGVDHGPVTGDTGYSSACCWVMRRVDLDAIGGFSPAYHPAYFEDVDLAMAAAAHSLRTRCTTRSTVVHHRQVATPTSERERLGLAAWQVFRNRWPADLRWRPPHGDDDWHYRLAMDLVHDEVVLVIDDAAQAIEMAIDQPRWLVVSAGARLGETGRGVDQVEWAGDDVDEVLRERRFQFTGIVGSRLALEARAAVIDAWQPQADRRLREMSGM